MGNELPYETGPTFIGFLGKHLRALTPVWILIGLMILYMKFGISHYVFQTIAILSFIGGFVLTWVRWWDEGMSAYIIGTIILIVFMKYGIISFSVLSFDVPHVLTLTKIYFLGSLVVMIYLELFRASITYRINTDSVEIAGGLIMKKSRTIMADKINDVIVKKMPLFDVGTIAITTASGLSLQEDTRTAGVGKEIKGGWIGGVLYSRSRKTESSDPLNVLYGVSEPEKVKRLIERIANIDREYERKELELLEEIKKNTSKSKT